MDALRNGQHAIDRANKRIEQATNSLLEAFGHISGGDTNNRQTLGESIRVTEALQKTLSDLSISIFNKRLAVE